MRPGVEHFPVAYDRPPPPGEILQEPLDGDPAHYARLCALEDGALPRPRDFGDYVDDICYMETVQAELFAHLLPACLQVWRHDLLHNHRSDYAGNVEIFQSALARRPLLDDCLTPTRRAAVGAFMRDAVLDRIDREDSLSHAGQYASAYAWFFRLGAFAVMFPELEALWRAWWRFETPGQAVAALQYASCLLYEDRDNPIFAPWTREDGGGTPGLWETDGQIFDGHWKMENVLFFMETVTPEYLHNALGRAKGALAGALDSEVPARMLAEFAGQQPLLEHRLAVLPDILSKQLDATLEWPPLAPEGN
jgi:hypothetical protein